jgi:hypothetical protein
MGNKTKLTPELIKNIAAALSNGITRETAARYARVSYQTFYNWRNRGKVEKERRDNGEKPNKKEKLYLDFFNQIDEGETEAIMNWQDTVNKAARTDPVWAFKMLTLRDPKGYFQNQVQPRPSQRTRRHHVQRDHLDASSMASAINRIRFWCTRSNSAAKACSAGIRPTSPTPRYVSILSNSHVNARRT